MKAFLVSIFLLALSLTASASAQNEDLHGSSELQRVATALCTNHWTGEVQENCVAPDTDLARMGGVNQQFRMTLWDVIRFYPRSGPYFDSNKALSLMFEFCVYDHPTPSCTANAILASRSN